MVPDVDSSALYDHLGLALFRMVATGRRYSMSSLRGGSKGLPPTAGLGILNAMTSSSSPVQPDSSVQADTPRKHRLTVDVGVATIVAACISPVAAVVIAFFVGQGTAQPATPSLTTPKVSHGPASVMITQPSAGRISFVSTLSGHVYKLQRGELVWTFFQPVNGNGSFAQQTYPIAGPCTVTFTKNLWTCRGAYIGKIKDHQMYRVCAAILNFAEAYTAGKLIENTYAPNLKADPYWFTSPPAYIHDYSPACTTVTRQN